MLENTSSKTKATIVTIIAALIVTIAIIAIVMIGKRGSQSGVEPNNEQTTAEISNVPENNEPEETDSAGEAVTNENDASSEQQSREPSGETESNMQSQSSSEGLIDRNIDRIAERLDFYITDAWVKSMGERLRKELKAFNITMDDNDLKTAMGTPLFHMTDHLLWTAWQKNGFKCELNTSDTYRCTMIGDWGHQAALTPAAWDDQLQDIHEVIANQWHGPAGSDRELQELSFDIIMQPDHNSGKLVLVPNEMLGV